MLGPNLGCTSMTSDRDINVDMAWRTALANLESWHQDRDRHACRKALMFLEVQLRTMVPAKTRATWPADRVDDVIRDLLTQLMEKNALARADNPKAFLRRALKNRFIDEYRKRSREVPPPRLHDDEPWDPADRETPSAPALAEKRALARQVEAAMRRLPMIDRVALKLEDATEWMVDDELDWLADRAGVERTELALLLHRAENIHALTHLFDPDEDEGEDLVARRKRMERFRRRRARAREKLRLLLSEVER